MEVRPSQFGLGAAEMVVILFVLAIFVVPCVFYILSLKRALEKCSPASRTMDPSQTWLLLIPLFNLVWNFIVVGHIARSLGNEFSSRGIPVEPEPGKSLGIAMCVLAACGVIPVLGVLGSLAGFVCWILYWVKIADYTRRLDLAPAGAFPPPLHPQQWPAPPPMPAAGRSSTNYLLIALACVAGFLLLIFVPAIVWLAVPRLTNARNAAQELAAVSAMRGIHVAETQYYSEFGRFASSLEQLVSAGIIDRTLASGEKGGFRFELRSASGGYVLRAEPVTFGSGAHTYYSDQTMTIHRHSGPEPAGESDPLVGEP